MEDEAVKFYQKLLGTEDANCSKVDVNCLQDLLQFQLPAEMRSFLIQPVTEAEIKAVVFSSPSNKSLGPDGYTSEFYKTSWPVIGCSRRKTSLPSKLCKGNMVIFADGSNRSLASVDTVLKEFYSISCLKVNYAKLEIFCCGIPEREVQDLTGTYGFKAGTLPVRYVGVPLITGKLTNKDLKSLISKITERMNSWASKHLSFVGRLQLITSIIQGITNFWCFTFFLPKKVIKEVEKLCNAFLWKNSTNAAKGAKVSWDSICFPKQKGSLGIKGLAQWNVACMMRFIWMIFSKAGSIWVVWVNMYLLKGKSFWTVNILANASWGWRKLLKLRTQARRLIRHKIGDGKDTYLWHDNWQPFGPLIEEYGTKIVQNLGISLNAKVSDVVNGNF
ncbi:hypothetical protein SLEP1_g49489 [Rubroshorea leprosula]|uniref:Uncharacterized protein n=1 Tax=Rubroshorea leprosula TaxID=152421 RepID=A0AAV5LZ83_9ROSI|nr:hypothetical protein SLEP1_g49489 [Rubroshorea leprosula]